MLGSKSSRTAAAFVLLAVGIFSWRALADTLWVATNAELLKLELGSGALLERLPAALRTRAVAIDDGAIDPAAPRVWTFDDTGLLQAFDLDGDLLATAPFLDASPKVFLTAGAGFAWLGFQHVVYQVDATGAVVATVSLAKELKDLTFDSAEGRVWLAHLQELRALDLAAQPAASLPLGLQALGVAINADRRWRRRSTRRRANTKWRAASGWQTPTACGSRR